MESYSLNEDILLEFDFSECLFFKKKKNIMRGIIYIIEVYIFSIIFLLPKGFAEESKLSPFQLTLKKESILLLSGISFQLAGNHFLTSMTVPDPKTLNSKNVNKFDRFASKFYSKKISYLSDNTKDATIILSALTLLLHFKNTNKKNILPFLNDLFLFLETETIIIGLTKCAKGLSKRPRPFVYNSNLPLENRQRRNYYESFWSGHTSLAFTTAVFTGYVYQNHNPGSHLIMPLWITGISFATATGILRVRSGNHFPSDIIVSAAVGSFIGWIIPRMHRRKSRSISLTSNVAGTTGLGLLYHF